MRILFIIILGVSLGCGSKQLATDTPISKNLAAKVPIVEMNFSKETDAYTITDAEVDGKTLRISVSYSGGCDEHTFELFTDGLLMKSLPPKQRFFLKHFAHEDGCERVIEQDLAFDLSGTTNAGNTLVLLLQNFDGDLRMEF